MLAVAALAGLAGSGVAGAWYVTRSPDPTESRTPGTAVADDSLESLPREEVPSLVRRYAPDLYFGRLEKWYPTDPRRYVIETDSDRVVDGFTALEQYSAAFEDPASPPAPTIFYHVTEAGAGVDVIQYWMYSVFDQFTVNFHWHDWELLQVFVDRETERPLLLSASAHSRAVPNNEFLEPDLDGDRRPGVLAEVGSHSSASEVNENIPSFDRLPTGSWDSDITNDAVDVTSQVTAPLAYGLPRDEGARLPFVMPELDDHPLHAHPKLAVARRDFVDEEATVGAWFGLPRPPRHLPIREAGLVLTHPESQTSADETYELQPIEFVRDAVDDFDGPQLSFQFVIPRFLENRLSGHLTSVGIPWEQDRFANPLDDVTDPGHRQRIDGETPDSLRHRVVGRVRQLGSGAEGDLDGVSDAARDALQDEITVSLFELPVEVATRLSSEQPVAGVTRSGTFGFLHIDPGEHLLVVNGPGYAPLATRFEHEGGLVQVGAAGELTVVAREDAGWIRGDGRDANGVERVRISEDYAGIVYAGQPVDPDRFAVAVHRKGRYTVDVVDRDGRAGAFRVGPEDFDETGNVVEDPVETGKASLVLTLRDVLVELDELASTLARRDQAEGQIAERVAQARQEAEEAAEFVAQEGARGVNDRLSSIISLLEESLEILLSDGQDGYRDTSVAALEPGIREGIARAEEALETGGL